MKGLEPCQFGIHLENGETLDGQVDAMVHVLEEHYPGFNPRLG